MSHKFAFFILSVVVLFSCTNQQHAQASVSSVVEIKKIPAAEFSDKIATSPDAIILDVRTSDEYKQGHIAKAINIDWDSDEFESQVKKLDKAKPVLVYCLSGARSASAAEYLSKNGFNEIYDLQGGLLKWREANFPEEKDSTAAAIQGMNLQEFEALIQTDKYVLVDFYTTWCGYCKLMEPSLDEISQTMGDKVEVIRIDAEQNEELAKHFKIDAFPTLKIYKNQKMTWENIGYQTKKQLLKQLQ